MKGLMDFGWEAKAGEPYPAPEGWPAVFLDPKLTRVGALGNDPGEVIFRVNSKCLQLCGNQWVGSLANS